MEIKVFVVTDGEYSNYHICGVFLDKTQADYFADRWGAEVEEWVTGDHWAELLKNKKVFFLRISKDGEITDLTEDEVDYDFQDIIDHPEFGYDTDQNLYVRILTTDKDHAIKIAGEKRGIILASGKWGDKSYLKEIRK